MENKGTSKILLELFKDKKLLFIENDFSLYHNVREFENWCIENKIRYHTIFSAEKTPLDVMAGIIDFADVVVYSTQYLTETSHQLYGLIESDYFTPKIIVELPLGDRGRLGYGEYKTKHKLMHIQQHLDDDYNEGNIDYWTIFKNKHTW